MVKSINLLLLLLLISSPTFSQNNSIELLKEYTFYSERNKELGKWWNKYFLKDGLIIKYESYWKNEFRGQVHKEYDDYNNLIKETHINSDGEVHSVIDIILDYQNNLLVKKVYSYGTTEINSNFHKSGKPQIIERHGDFIPFPNKEILEYDDSGNLIKSIEFTTTPEGWKGPKINDIETTNYKYDERNNVIEIYRQLAPKRDFPIIMTGGPSLYEFEYFRYKYNKRGLWTKKYKTVNGKEKLIAKRIYK